MMRIAHAGNAHAVSPGGVDGYSHAHDGWRVPQAGIGIDERCRARLPDHVWPRLQIQPAVAARRVIVHEHGQAMRVDARQVGVDHDFGAGLRLRWRNAPGQQ